MSCTLASPVWTTSLLVVASPANSTCPSSFRTFVISLPNCSRLIPRSRPPSCIVVCRHPKSKDLSFDFTHAKMTSDFRVDRLEQWWQEKRPLYPKVDTLLLDLDNGPENHSRRSQFIYRLVLFAQATQLTIVLVYYPPYHSKYNPIERCWGVLEVYWNGELLVSEAAVLGFAGNMTYAGKHPHVHRVSQTYLKGVRRTKDEMQTLERRLVRRE